MNRISRELRHERRFVFRVHACTRKSAFRFSLMEVA